MSQYEQERRERKDMRRNLERVLLAAHTLFAERGADVTMEEVARHAGVGVATIYRRFASKEELFSAVSRAVCAEAENQLVHASAGATDPLTRLRAIVLVQLQRNERYAALMEMRPDLRLKQHGCGADVEHNSLYHSLHTLLHDAIVEARAAGALPPGADPSVQAALCLELLSPRAYQHLSHSIGGGPAMIAEHVLRFCLHGLGAPLVERQIYAD